MESSTAPEAGDSPQAPAVEVLPPERQRYIFISYGHDETAPPNERIAPLPERLKTDLEKRGHHVWIDFDELSPGTNWMSLIEHGLKDAAADPAKGRFLLLMTPHSVRPDGFCLNEILRAQDLRLRIVPVLVLQCDRPICIYNLQYLPMDDCIPCDQRESEYQKSFRELVKAIELEFSQPLELNPVETDLQKKLQYLEYGGNIKFHLPNFTGRDWVFRAIDEWLQNPKARRVFLLTGWAGTGKSAISAHLCAQRKDIKAFHFCVYNDTAKRDARRCIRSLAYQLSTQFDDYRQQLQHVDWNTLNEGNAKSNFDELFVSRLGKVRPDKPGPYLVIIDALDEATLNGQNELAEFFGTTFEAGPDWLRILITTRPTGEVMSALSQFPSFDLDPDRQENTEDIRAYAKKELSVDSEGNPLPENVVDAAVSAIAVRSEGVFLYAHWVCRDIKEGNLSIAQTDGFPKGLGNAYFLFFSRLYPGGQGYEKVRPILGVLSAAYDPLREDILDAIFHSGVDTSLTLRPLIPIFPCVVGSYRAFHKSILDWLASAKEEGYQVDLKDGHKHLAGYCWDQCQERLTEDLRLQDDFKTYPFRHGVRHLIEDRRFADAVELLDYLFRHSGELEASEREELDQLAKLLTIALGDALQDKNDKPRTIQEAKRLSAQKLADRIAGLYMAEPLKGGISVLVKYHPDEWPQILEQLLRKDDYVLRYTIADVLAEEYNRTGRQEQLQAIQNLLDSRELNHQELGAYALKGLYAADKKIIEREYLNRLANGPIYPFRSALGDLLLGLGLQDVGTNDFGRLDIMHQVDANSKFWNPIWDFNRMDVVWLRALNYFGRRQPLPSDAPADIATAYNSLQHTDTSLQELLNSKGLPPEVKPALESCYKLGVKDDLIPQKAAIVKRMPVLQKLFEVLFANPLWSITETAASLLASVVDEDPQSARLIRNLFQHEQWRVRYGAAEAAFLSRFSNRNELFIEAIQTFYNHPEPLLRGNVAENLTAWILDTVPSKRPELISKFQKEITHWLTDENEDAWILDHVYRLFHQLRDEGLTLDETPLQNVSVSTLLAGDPVWYTLERQDFLLQIEDRKRSKIPSAQAAVGGKQ